MTDRDVLGSEESAAVQPKRPWHPPLLEEIDYTATEGIGGPGAFLDGYTTYSVP